MVHANMSHFHNFYLVTALAAVILLILWKFKKNLRQKECSKSLPGPRGLPLVGYLPFLRPNLHELFMELAQIYGPIYKLRFGSKQCVIISSPSLVKQVVRDHDTTFANRNPTIAAAVFSYGGNDIAFLPYGEKWRMLRKIFVHEMQSNANLDAFYPLRRNEVRKSVIELYGNVGKPVSVAEMAFATVINMVSGMFWGKTFQVDEELQNIGATFREAASRLIEILGRPNISDFFPILARFDIQGVERDMKEASQRIGKIYDFVIDGKREQIKGREEKGEDEGRVDFLHFLLKFRDQETGRPITQDQIKALLMDIVVGGTDTTSTTIVWAMAELMLHPQVMKKAQEELSKVVGVNDVVEEFHTHRLPYLHAIMKETLRLHPVAPLLLPRSPTKSCNIGGYTIPKGAKVFVNAWAMHRDPIFWDQPTNFEPERFLLDTIDGGKLDYKGNNMQYIPFGSGRRICAGLALGERMAMYVLATLLHMFNWELPNGAKPDTSEKFGVVLEKSTPLIVIPSPRLSNSKLYE